MKGLFYVVDIKYIQYLNKIDNEVFYDPNNVNYKNKPYYGILINDGNKEYCVPLTSIKKKHLKLKTTGLSYMLIYEKVKNNKVKENGFFKAYDNKNSLQLLALLDFKKSIPVNKELINSLDIKSSSKKILLQKELEFCNKNSKKIFKYADNYINAHKGIDKPFGACDFEILEQACYLYSKFQQLEEEYLFPNDLGFDDVELSIENDELVVNLDNKEIRLNKDTDIKVLVNEIENERSLTI